ncbi:MAG: hypothetical protein H7A52_02095 [Akkermansiaceae bacterium]|nr:hypothetical protein [Akkermansiaceae bacterium]
MNITEYQAKELRKRQHGPPTMRSQAAAEDLKAERGTCRRFTPADAEGESSKNGFMGGVHFGHYRCRGVGATSPKRMIGQVLVTHQTEAGCVGEQAAAQSVDIAANTISPS